MYINQIVEADRQNKECLGERLKEMNREFTEIRNQNVHIKQENMNMRKQMQELLDRLSNLKVYQQDKQLMAQTPDLKSYPRLINIAVNKLNTKIEQSPSENYYNIIKPATSSHKKVQNNLQKTKPPSNKRERPTNSPMSKGSRERDRKKYEQLMHSLTNGRAKSAMKSMMKGKEKELFNSVQRID